MLQLHLSDYQFYCLLSCDSYKKFDSRHKFYKRFMAINGLRYEMIKNEQELIKPGGIWMVMIANNFLTV